MELNVLQHLNNLYVAARQANLNAQSHEQVLVSAQELEKWVKQVLEDKSKKEPVDKK